MCWLLGSIRECDAGSVVANRCVGCCPGRLCLLVVLSEAASTRRVACPARRLCLHGRLSGRPVIRQSRWRATRGEARPGMAACGVARSGEEPEGRCAPAAGGDPGAVDGRVRGSWAGSVRTGCGARQGKAQLAGWAGATPHAPALGPRPPAQHGVTWGRRGRIACLCSRVSLFSRGWGPTCDLLERPPRGSRVAVAEWTGTGCVGHAE